jgi:hypothetical protein
MVCADLNLFGKELVAVDGSKFRAVNSGDRNFTTRMVEKKIKELDKRIERYLKDMDEQDENDSVVCSTFRYGGTKDLTAEELKKKIDALKDRKNFYALISVGLFPQSGRWLGNCSERQVVFRCPSQYLS